MSSDLVRELRRRRRRDLRLTQADLALQVLDLGSTSSFFDVVDLSRLIRTGYDEIAARYAEERGRR